MSGNHFLRSMAVPAVHGLDGNAGSTDAPGVHFADAVSVVTEVNKLAETPLVDIPLELTTINDPKGTEANQRIRRSASRDRDMKDEEGFVLRSVPREPSEGPPANTVDVSGGVERFEILLSSGSGKHKLQGATGQATTNGIPKGRKRSRKGNKSGEGRNEGSGRTKARRGVRRNILPPQDEPVKEFRRSKRRKSQ